MGEFKNYNFENKVFEAGMNGVSGFETDIYSCTAYFNPKLCDPNQGDKNYPVAIQAYRRTDRRGPHRRDFYFAIVSGSDVVGKELSELFARLIKRENRVITADLSKILGEIMKSRSVEKIVLDDGSPATL